MNLTPGSIIPDTAALISFFQVLLQSTSRPSASNRAKPSETDSMEFINCVCVLAATCVLFARSFLSFINA